MKKATATVLPLRSASRFRRAAASLLSRPPSPPNLPRTSQAAAEEPYYEAIVAPFTGDNAMYGEFIYHGVMTKRQSGQRGRRHPTAERSWWTSMTTRATPPSLPPSPRRFKR